MTKDFKGLAEKAVLWAVNGAGKTVYKEIVSVHDYYDGEHPWDSADWLRRKSIVLRGGLLIDRKGDFLQNFIITVNPRTGRTVSSVVSHGDGTVFRD